jgi:hypothetical protein
VLKVTAQHAALATDGEPVAATLKPDGTLLFGDWEVNARELVAGWPYPADEEITVALDGRKTTGAEMNETLGKLSLVRAKPVKSCADCARGVPCCPHARMPLAVRSYAAAEKFAPGCPLGGYR